MIKYMFYLLKIRSSFSKITDHPPWDQLPIHVWNLVFERLDLEDRIRCNLVCKEWGTLTKRTCQYRPWLMLPYEPDHEYLSFFDMHEGKVRKLNLPKSARGGWFFGCSKGWLFLAIGTSVDDLQIYLFDPISRAQIPLPPLPTTNLDCEDSFADERSGWNPAACLISEIEVSSSDASSCIVAATFSSSNNKNIMALCRPHDERWTVVEGLLADGYGYGNMLFFDGELYACLFDDEDEANDNNNQAQAPFRTHPVTVGKECRVNLNLICCTPPPTHLFHTVDADETVWCYEDSFRVPYLVESNGQLLMVTQTCDSMITWDDETDDPLMCYHQAATFEVSKIDSTDETTMCITRLADADVGNRSLFVGNGGCFAAENPNEVDKKCIYFLEIIDYSDATEQPLATREAGVYDVDDGSIKRCFPSIKAVNHGSYMHWFSPNIKSRLSA